MAGTNLFIGGIAPGIVVNPRIGGASPFSGCISKVDSFIIPFFYVLALSLQSIILNGKEVDLTVLLNESSSGITECKPRQDEQTEEIHPPFIWTTTPSTTRTTILVTTSHYPRTTSAWETVRMETGAKEEEELEKPVSEGVETTTKCTGDGMFYKRMIKLSISQILKG
ncbi:unnamed protein product [Gongylonema pulchrum]|uniref:Xanthine/uracil permease family protein n=1 Tax=Gongylonema pulchrum TaxID=637853 RepID=A0A183EZ38_9BILA|nr:unnamed protein product [Gongylonema pulchrum]